MLILLALALLNYNQAEDVMVGQETQGLLQNMKSMIAENEWTVTQQIQLDMSPEEETSVDIAKYIDGYEYIGIISIPSISLELPVMSQWDYDRLKISPCRHVGSIEGGDLVIAAHNYKSHFGNLHKLQVEDNLSITDMVGNVYRYEVVEIKIVKPTATEEVQQSGYDLVLYTCTLSGKTRVTVFCNEI